MRLNRLEVISIVLIFVFCSEYTALAQPYSAQLKTDPDVGNVQGIQRRGRSLKIDPDQGTGWDYHVFPVARTASLAGDKSAPQRAQESPSATPLAILRSLTTPERQTVERSLSKISALPNLQNEIHDLREQIAKLEEAKKTASGIDALGAIDRNISEKNKALQAKQQELTAQEADVERALQVISRSVRGSATTALPGFYAPSTPAPFNSTAGIRRFGTPSGPEPFPGADAERALTTRRTIKSGQPDYEFPQVYQQPMIQVRVRVVEVARIGSLQVSSVLDYVNHQGDNNPLFTINNVNGGRNRTTGVTRFPPNNAAGLLGIGDNSMMGLANLNTGSGLLVNLTSDHINYLAELLASEFQADVVTAPEVVTLNGQNVEFVAGRKSPFPLGQNVVHNQSNSIQQVFYKHVGSYISVTPTIVNWGKHSEGRGMAAITEGQIADWSALVEWMLLNLDAFNLPQNHSDDLDLKDIDDLKQKRIVTEATDEMVRPAVHHVHSENAEGPIRLQPVESTPSVVYMIPIEIRSKILNELNKYSRIELVNRGFPILYAVNESECCSWNPQDCTIDLSIVIRLSEGNQGSIDLAEDQAVTVSTSEDNVRAIANVIQVKSGHGVVMAGLIGERDVESINKVPVLGDIPIVGFAFRSKATNRQKTEVLIFVEARALDPNPDVARAESYEDFVLGEPYVSGQFLDNPLEYGMYRAGFGTYLPPRSPQERVFWERLGRKVRKAATAIDDAFE